MICTQNQALLQAEKQLQDLVAFVRQATDQQERIDQVERHLMQQLLQLGLSLLTGFVAGSGDGDHGETIPGPEVQTWRRLPDGDMRCFRPSAVEEAVAAWEAETWGSLTLLPRVQAFECGTEPWQKQVADWLKTPPGEEGAAQIVAEGCADVWLYETAVGDLLG